MRKLLLAGAAASLLVAAPAAADGFYRCDGYFEPTRKADGMNKGSGLWGLITTTQDIRRGAVSLGEWGVAACDAALADPLLQSVFWQRRAHLLQAKAAHQLALGRNEDALATLAASDAVGAARNDPFFNQSILLGNRALRAYALYRLGTKDAARVELDAILKARPYASDLLALTRSIRLAFEADRELQNKVLRDAAPLNPAVLAEIFWISLLYGDFDTAVRIGQQLSFDLPRGRGDWQIQGLDDRKYDLIERRAVTDGAIAYALIATGRTDAGKKRIADARADVAEAIQPPPPPPPGKKLGKSVAADYEKRTANGAKATEALDTWEKLIALRARAATLTAQSLGEEVRSGKLGGEPVVADLILQLKPATAVEQSTVRDLLKYMGELADRQRAELYKFSLTELVKMLPRPETSEMRPKYSVAGDGILLSDQSGAYVRRENGSPYINVRYGDRLASQAMIEELGMLAVATQARKAGKDSVLIDARMFIRRTIQSYGGSINNGYETRLRVLPINAAELPAGLEPSRWRLIRVQDIYDRLYPVYSVPNPR